MKKEKYISAGIKGIVGTIWCAFTAIQALFAQGAGPNQTICQNYSYLQPNDNPFNKGVYTIMAATGTGRWAQLPSNPPGLSVNQDTLRNTVVRGIAGPGVYGFVWGAAVGDTMYITILPAPARPTVNTDGFYGVYCVGSDSVIARPVGSVDSILWWWSNELIQTTLPSDTVYFPTNQFMYSIQTVGTNGCASIISDTDYFYFCGKPGPNQTICVNNTATMAAGDAGTWSAIASNPAATAITTPSSPTTTITGFTLPGTYGFKWNDGTFVRDTAYILVGATRPLLTVVGACLGSDSLIVHGATSTDSIIWFFNSFDFGTNGKDTVYHPGIASAVTVQIISGIGCESVLSDTVNVQNCNNITSPDTVTICRGSSFNMHNIAGGSNSDTYLWIPPTGLSSNAVLDPVANPVVTTRYTLIAIDTTGIAYYDTVLIIVDSVCTGFVWPGDADDNGIVDNIDLLPIGLTYGLTGPARPQQDINWYAHSATPWAGTNSGGINNVYSDCDGNDTVDVNDVQAILQNYSLTHAKTNTGNSNRSGAPVLKMTVTPDTVLNGDTLTCHIILGDSTIPASNVYGLAFTFNFNPLVVDTTSVKMTFPDSWLATQSEHIMLAKNETSNGNIYAGLSRIDRNARSGSGEIATVTMVITTDNIDGKNLSYYTDQLGISTVKVINQLGDTIPVNAAGDSAIIGFLPLGISSCTENSVSIKLFPDPVNNLAHIRSAGGRMDGLILRDMLGRQVAGYYSINASNFDLPTNDLAQGVYFAQIIIGNNNVVKKFLVQH